MITTIITTLYLLGFLTAHAASSFLYIMGALLILAEIVTLTTFGILIFNGLFAIAVAYMIDTGAQTLFGLELDWPFLFGIAFAEGVVFAGCVLAYLRFKNKKITTGAEAMIGEAAKIIEWSDRSGRASIHGEVWNAESEKPYKFKKGDTVYVSDVAKMKIFIQQNPLQKD